MLVVNTINKFFKEFTWKWYLVRRGEKHSCSWSPTRPTWRQMQTSNNLATSNTHYFFIVLQSEWQCLVFITLFKETEVQSKKREMLSPWINVVQIRHRKKKTYHEQHREAILTQRETVEGEASVRSSVSNSSFTCSDRYNLSPFNKFRYYEENDYT